MKIGIQTWGSHGDIKPFLLLAKTLANRGHQIQFVYTSVDASQYHSHALPNLEIIDGNYPFTGDPQGFFQKILNKKSPFEQILLLIKHLYNPALKEMHQKAQALCEHNDLVIGHMLCYPLYSASLQTKCPRVAVQLAPVGIPTAHQPPAGIPALGKFSNRFFWRLADSLCKNILFSEAKRFHKSLELPPLKSIFDLYQSKPLTLVATSAQITPHHPDFPEHVHFTSSWETPNLKASTELDPSLQEFLKENSNYPFVFFGFGSLSQTDEEANLELFEKAISRLEIKAIIQTPLREGRFGHSFYFKRGDHNLIFPKCQLVVHHGGAGTTQTALFHGTPSLIVSHGFDQDFWGASLFQKGLGPQPLKRKSLQALTLAYHIKSALKEASYPKKCRELAEQLQKENGLEFAAELIERHFQ